MAIDNIILVSLAKAHLALLGQTDIRSDLLADWRCPIFNVQLYAGQFYQGLRWQKKLNDEHPDKVEEDDIHHDNGKKDDDHHDKVEEDDIYHYNVKKDDDHDDKVVRHLSWHFPWP